VQQVEDEVAGVEDVVALPRLAERVGHGRGLPCTMKWCGLGGGMTLASGVSVGSPPELEPVGAADPVPR